MYHHVHIKVKYTVIPVVFKIDFLQHEVSLETFILYISFFFFLWRITLYSTVLQFAEQAWTLSYWKMLSKKEKSFQNNLFDLVELSCL